MIDRRVATQQVARHLPVMERWPRRIQAAAGVMIIAIGVVTIAQIGR